MTKKTLLTVIAVSVLSAGVVGATNAFAQTTTPDQNPVTSLVQDIADKFHLNKKDVQAVFDQHRSEMQTKMEANYESYLTELVTSGKITDAQKQLLLSKHKELVSQMESNKDSFKNMTPAEKQAKMQATKQDLENWAKQNGIDSKYLRPFGRFGKFGMHPPIGQ